jgi:hypothetical protein
VEGKSVSIAVELAELQKVSGERQRSPFFLTVSDDGRPHSVEASWSWSGDELELAVGNRTLANTQASPLVALVWPADELGGYSLIVDAEVTDARGADDGDNVVRLRPTRAVLHRPATGPTDSACAADCEPILNSGS